MMAAVDIYLDGFRSQKLGIAEHKNPFPTAQQPAHSTWRSGWKRGKDTPHVGLDGVPLARAEFIALRGST